MKGYEVFIDDKRANFLILVTKILKWTCKLNTKTQKVIITYLDDAS